MKAYISVDVLDPSQWELIGVEFKNVEHDIQRAASIFAQKLQIELLNEYYQQDPGAFQATQPEEILAILRKEKSMNSPYPPALIQVLGEVDQALDLAWNMIQRHEKADRLRKNKARDIKDHVGGGA